jgi:hypothetical protein
MLHYTYSARLAFLSYYNVVSLYGVQTAAELEHQVSRRDRVRIETLSQHLPWGLEGTATYLSCWEVSRLRGPLHCKWGRPWREPRRTCHAERCHGCRGLCIASEEDHGGNRDVPVMLRGVTAAEAFALQVRKTNGNINCGSRIAVSTWPPGTGNLFWSADVQSLSSEDGWLYTVHGGRSNLPI